MQLEMLRVTRGAETVRVVQFKRGLNLILDTPTSQQTKSGNNVGKTTVLRLIDFCLGSDGTDIWQDSEFKTINQDIYDFLHGTIPVIVELVLVSRTGNRHTLSRAFNKKKKGPPTFWVNGNAYKKVADYCEAVRGLLFLSGGSKPSLRQLAAKFVRSSPHAMGRTLKFLSDHTRDSEYEALHLFLFGFTNVEVLEERPRLNARRIKLERDLLAITRQRNEGAIEQLVLHLQREIHELSVSNQARGEVPEIAAHANRVTEIRAQAANLTASLGQVEGEISAIRLAIAELAGEYDDIDHQAIENIYKDAQRYFPDIQRDWKELLEFIKNLRGRKERFLKLQIEDLEIQARDIRAQLEAVLASESAEIDELLKSREFGDALKVRAELLEKLKTLGGLEKTLKDIRELKTSIAEVLERIAETRQKIEQEKAKLIANVATFNSHFAKLSKELYGEEYLLDFDESDKGTFTFKLSSVGSNVGMGKKASQTAAFDLAYIEFLHAAKIPFPTFVCHDGIESIHGNQLQSLLAKASLIDGQLIISTLRDKLPVLQDSLLQKSVILELSQEDRFFHI